MAYYARNPEYGFCRGLANHVFTVKQLDRAKGKCTVVLHCGNCKSTRTDVVELDDGIVEARTYKYPQAYHVKNENGKRVGKRVFRREYLLQALKKE